MKVKNSKRLGEIAIEEGVLTPAQLDECLAAQRTIADVGCRKQLGEVMVDKKLVDADGRDRLLRIQREKHQHRYLGEYELGAKLGQGGMGAVFKATRVRDGKVFALKLLNKEIEHEPGAVDRFEREAKLASTLIHPHLVRTFGPEVVEGRRALVMEFVDGTPLDQRITKLGKLDEEEALKIAHQLALALAYIGGEGIIHRDIKPGNVMVDQAGDAKLLDLGLARFAQNATRTQITMTGQIVGTPDFMAPEQIIGQSLDVRTDVYALGATLYMMVTGQAPYAGRGDQQAVLLAHLSGTLRDPLELAPDLSEGAVHVIEKAMATEPADRYQDMATFATDLEAVLVGQPPTQPRPAIGQTTVQRTVPTARRNVKPRRRRVSGRQVGRAAQGGVPGWVGPVVGGAALLVALAVMVGRGADDAGAGGGSGHAPPVRPNVGSGSGSGSREPVPRTVYVDPTWGYKVELAPGWSAERAKDPPVSSFGGPAGALVAIETRALGPRCPDVPTDVLVDVERLLLARRLGVALDTVTRQSFKLGEATLQAAVAPGSGGKVELTGYLRSAGCVHRVIASRMAEETLRTFLGRVRLDPRAEERAAEGAAQPIAFEHPPVTVWHLASWTAKPQGPGVILARGTHAMVVRGGPYADVDRTAQADPALRDYTQSVKLNVAGMQVNVALGFGQTGLVVVRGIIALPDQRGLGVFAWLDPTCLDFEALLAPWQVIAMAQVAGDAPKPEAAAIVEDAASRARLFARWGWQPDARYNQYLVDAKEQLVGYGATGITVSNGQPGQLPAGVIGFAHLHSPPPLGSDKVIHTVGWHVVAEPTGVRLLSVFAIDHVGRVKRDYMYVAKADAWFRMGAAGQRELQLAVGRLDGIYEPRSPVAHQLWLHGWEPVPGATRSLRLLDPWAERVVALELKVPREPQAKMVVECAIDGRRVCYLVFSDRLPQGVAVRQEGGDVLGYGHQ